LDLLMQKFCIPSPVSRNFSFHPYITKTLSTKKVKRVQQIDPKGRIKENRSS